MKIELTRSDLRKWTGFLLLANVLLVAVYLPASMLPERLVHLAELFDLDGEANLPTWFASAELLLIGLLLLMYPGTVTVRKGPSRRFFVAAGLGFLFLSVDEQAGIHERVNGVLDGIAWAPQLLSGTAVWMGLYFLVAAVLLVAFHADIAIFWEKHRRVAWLFVFAAAVFLLGAVGSEVVAHGILHAPEASMTYRLLVALEELGELCGTTLFLYATAELVFIGGERVPRILWQRKLMWAN